MQEILLQNSLSGGEGGGLRTVDELVENCFVLGYGNDNFWWDVHPNLLPLLKEHQSRGT
jgi:hypothetical protein